MVEFMVIPIWLPALRLGQRLGYARDYKIRDLIKNRRLDLEKAGALISVMIARPHGGGAFEEFFLRCRIE
jgi:hypothetical protein